jgi:RNA polymerase sigma-70 factor (ECF subfamily)
VNLTLDHHRRKRRRIWGLLFSDRSEENWIDVPTADPRDNINLQQEVRLVIDKLPEVYRTVLILRELESFSTSEIAAILDRREATIRWRLAEARNRFQVLWQQRQPK